MKPMNREEQQIAEAIVEHLVALGRQNLHLGTAVGLAMFNVGGTWQTTNEFMANVTYSLPTKSRLGVSSEEYIVEIKVRRRGGP